MAKLTEHLRLPADGAYRPPPVPDDFDGVGPLAPNSRAQQRRAAAFVLDVLGDGPAAREVLQALFQPPRRPRVLCTRWQADAVKRHRLERAS